MKQWKVILVEKDGFNVRSFYIKAKTLLHAMAIAGRADKRLFLRYTIKNIVRVY